MSCASFAVKARPVNSQVAGDNGCDAITYTATVEFMAETYQVGHGCHVI